MRIFGFEKNAETISSRASPPSALAGPPSTRAGSPSTLEGPPSTLAGPPNSHAGPPSTLAALLCRPLQFPRRLYQPHQDSPRSCRGRPTPVLL